MESVQGKVAVVTGAASGMGRAMAQTFVNAGMKVVLSDVDEATLVRTTQAMKDAGGDVIGVVANVAKIEQIQALGLRRKRDGDRQQHPYLRPDHDQAG